MSIIRGEWVRGKRPIDLIGHISQIAARIPKQIAHIGTKESTKTALVMPFINALGYDVFNPFEVAPEFTADVGTNYSIVSRA